VGNSVICNGVTDVDLASDPLWPSSWPQPPPPHQRRLRIRDLRKPGPRACCISCSPPTTRRQLHQRSERPCTPSAFTSHNASTMPRGCPQQPGTSDTLKGIRPAQTSRQPARRQARTDAPPGSGASRAHHRRTAHRPRPGHRAHPRRHPQPTDGAKTQGRDQIDRDYEQLRSLQADPLDDLALTTPAPLAG